MNRTLLPLVVSFAALACAAFTQEDFKAVDAQAYPISEICIEENPSVKVAGMMSILEAGFARHSIKTKVYVAVPDSCEYFLKYTATQRWDFKPFLSDARLAVYKQGLLIGFAERRGTRGVFGGGGLAPEKWASAEDKLNPMIDRLLEGFRRPA